MHESHIHALISLYLVFLLPLSWFATSPKPLRVRETRDVCEGYGRKFKAVLKVKFVDFRGLGAMTH